MDLSIIIVSWNVRDHLRDCLASIYKYTTGLDYEVFVVDNDSHDGSADMVAKDFQQTHLIRNKKNRGFGAANNQALSRAKGRYILFLNDDTEIQDNILQRLVSKYDSETRNIGMIGCRLVNPDGSQQDSIRAFPTAFDQTAILLKMHHIFPWLISGYMQKKFDYSKEQAVDQVMGAFMLMPKKLLDKFGSFDETFFAWFEEVDLQKRLQNEGYDVLYTPEVKCIHVKGASFKQLRKPKAQKIFNHSMRYYFKKNNSLLSYLWIAIVQPISIFFSYVTQILR
ncbi:MAG: glycosyltransferase family 2 protein [bacterium]|nr:glycosyltransferase family 2 protein [bacterium]